MCQQVLEEYFDGELDAAPAAEVRRHLGICAACSAMLAELRQEHELFARYQRDVEVTPALWAGIEARMKAEKAARPVAPKRDWRSWFTGLFTMPHISPAFAAAMVVLAIGVTVVVMSYLHSRNTNSGNPPVAVVPPPAPPAPQPGIESHPDVAVNPNKETGKPAVVKEAKPPLQKQLAVSKPQAPPDPMKLVREAEQKYQAAIAILAKDVSRRRSQIDPAVLARFDSALADIDRTIQETRQIVRRNPDDPVALQYLLGAYAKKVDTLRAMTLD
ncbi:MAG TPA: anti-sigma factor [Blastocatellia bacterium]|nr:anti-sigma factor [Blastocatellia bacterium]